MSKFVTPYRVGFSSGEIDEFLRRAKTILETGALIPGVNNELLEQRFAALVHVNFATAVASGTAALEIAFRALNLSGKTILVPANTNYATAEAVIRAGGRPMLYDSGLHATLANIEAAGAADVAALVVVHIGGYICPELTNIQNYCHDRGILLIEDAAHAHGASLRGKLAGSFGVAAAFSLFATKVVTTAEGGMLVTDDDAIHQLSRRYRDQGKANDGLHNELFGSAWRMSELHAALGVVQMGLLETILDRSNEIIRRYVNEIEHPLITVPFDRTVRYSGHKFIIIVPDGKRRSLREHLMDNGVGTAKGVYDVPLHHQPALTFAAPGNYPDAEQFAMNHLCLPMWKGLTDTEVDQVVDAVNLWPEKN